MGRWPIDREATRIFAAGVLMGVATLFLFPLLALGQAEGEQGLLETLPANPTPVVSQTAQADQTWDNRQKVRVLVGEGKVEEMTMADYLWRVVAAEMPASFEPQALRAQAAGADYLGSGAVFGSATKKDAVPMTLGQEFEAFAANLTEEVERLNQMARFFQEINMGATAIGTGINAAPGYAELVTSKLSAIVGMDFIKATNLIEATPDTGSYVIYSSALKRLAVKLSKISNDLRLLASGPRCGLAEINLPARQPGSSIMPGKVNPVIPEVVSQVAFKIIGNELCVTMAGEAAQMELNAMEPVMAQCSFESVDLMANACDTLRTLCVEGITSNEENCRREVNRSIGIVTALNPYIGYEHSTEIAKKAMETGRGVVELVLEEGILTQEDLNAILDAKNMVRPVKLDIHPKH